uniref:SIR2-like domain-containing protein n=1 Tax=Candidatus Kentrum eta TaxID=2126337 RepID=A0A450UQX0_9GAMM|nr:MAG: SIR2-like domain-containing protein [Candidatus Kentron sp. H]VFJ88680.1 MAG: SIR2-like domain-containing protein [Candidatus Kentron sp. H]VFJ94948.1 MAG: SIR2-like domain-containing protein [Candidatus Kentron sp. H]
MSSVVETNETAFFAALKAAFGNCTPFTVLLGAGASLEGRVKGERFPLYEELQRRIVTDVLQLDSSELSSNALKDRFEEALEILRHGNNTLQNTLRPHLDGTPGLAHAYLACLAYALREKSLLLRILTTNFDNLFGEAAGEVFKNGVHRRTLSDISRGSEKEAGGDFRVLDNLIHQGQMIILHMFGDLSFSRPIFFPTSVLTEKFTTTALGEVKKYFASPLLVIGYSFIDPALQSFLAESQQCDDPIFVIDPDPENKWKRNFLTTRKAYHFNGTFREFMLEVMCRIDHLTNKEVGEKKITELMNRFPLGIRIPDMEALSSLCAKISAPALSRTEFRVFGIAVSNDEAREKNCRQVLIEREDTAPNLKEFMIAPSASILLTVGGSGAGKTTLAWQTATWKQDDFLPVFFDAQSFNGTTRFTEILGDGFGFTNDTRQEFLNVVDNLLNKNGQKILLIVDGVNEAGQNVTDGILNGILQIANYLPDTIKILVTIREVSWELIVKEETKAQRELLYRRGAYFLRDFSEKETEKAYAQYREAYDIKKPFENIKGEIRAKLRYPLMLRIVAEVYQGDDIPDYVPATKVFKDYTSRKKKRLKEKDYKFLFQLVDSKVDALISSSGYPRGFSDRFDEFEFLNAGSGDIGDSFLALAEEGILSRLDDDESLLGHTYRFTYDRYFEYLLGRCWGKKLVNRVPTPTIEEAVRPAGNSVIAAQAMVSTLVSQNLESSKNNLFDLSDGERLQSVIFSDDETLARIGRQALRQLTYDSQINFLALIPRDHLPAAKVETIIELAGDSPKATHFLVDGLFISHPAVGDRDWLRELAVRKLFDLCIEASVYDVVRNALLKRVSDAEIFDDDLARGLMFFSAVVFSVNQQDPFKELSALWRRVLVSRREPREVLLSIITRSFVSLSRELGPKFIVTMSDHPAFGEYCEDVPDDARNLAMALAAMLTHVDRDLRDEDIEIIGFFGSRSRNWSEFKARKPNPASYAYPVEYRIAQWVLLLHGLRDFSSFRAALDCIASGHLVQLIDYALNAMKFFLQNFCTDNPQRILIGLGDMMRWVERAKSTFRDQMMAPLSEDDPMTSTFNMLSQTARIHVLAAPNKSIDFLVEHIMSMDEDERKLGLLSVRHLLNEYPLEVALTLECLNDETDNILIRWRNIILREMFVKYRRQAEEFLVRNKLGDEHEKFIAASIPVDSKRIRSYFADDFYRQIFLDDPRRHRAAEYYMKAIQAEDYESFARYLVGEIFSTVLEGGP